MTEWAGVAAAAAALAFLAGARGVRGLMAWYRQRRLIRRVGPAARPRALSVADELALPFGERVLTPLVNRLAEAVAARLLPERVAWDVGRKLKMAGSSLSPGLFVLSRIGVAAGLALLGGLLDASGLIGPGMSTLVPLGLGVVGYLYWGARLNTQVQRAQEELERALPEAFDLLAVSVVAGLSFEAALRRTAPRLPGVAGREFQRVVADLEVGLSRTDALRQLADRTRVAELGRFATLVAHAERTGSGMTPVLHAEADRVKDLRISRAREQAALVPVKILFPLVLFILPALFVTILGGGIVSMINAFGQGSL
jgi:tight adherence protein C